MPNTYSRQDLLRAARESFFLLEERTITEDQFVDSLCTAVTRFLGASGLMNAILTRFHPGDATEMDRLIIAEGLRIANGSTSKAAKLLGYSVRKIQYRCRDWGVKATDFNDGRAVDVATQQDAPQDQQRVA